MSLYQNLLKSMDVKRPATCGITEVAPMADKIFDDFRKKSGWPADGLKFTEPEMPIHYESKPSNVLSTVANGYLGATAVFTCAGRTIEQPFSIGQSDGGFMIKFGPNTVNFDSDGASSIHEFIESVVQARFEQGSK